MQFFAPQEFKLSLSSPDYAIEKRSFGPINKNNIKIITGDDTFAIVGSNEISISNTPFDYNIADLGVSKGDQAVAYLYPSRFTTNVNMGVYAGRYVLSCEQLKSAKLQYNVVIYFTILISNFKLLIEQFRETLTYEELTEKIKEKVQSLIQGECRTYLSGVINESTTPNKIFANKAEFYDQVRVAINKSISRLGLVLSSIDELKLNETEETTAKLQEIAQRNNENAMIDIDIEKAKKNKELEGINKKEEEVTPEVKPNDVKETFAPKIEVTIINNNDSEKKKEDAKPEAKGKKYVYCSNCGKKIEKNTAKFCSDCGTRID